MILLVIAYISLSAKVRYTPVASERSISKPAWYPASPAETARLITRFIESRESHTLGRMGDDEPIFVSDAQHFSVARHWERLSPEVQNRYRMALLDTTGVPLTYRTPSGQCIIHYALSGVNAVSSRDTMGYGSGFRWREKSRTGNGIPDYIDETAWALDSSWSLEVERFGFPPPTSAIHQTGVYPTFHVYIRNLPSTVYGYTWYIGKTATGSPGHASICEIRNRWDGWVLSETLDYDKRPEDGLRVTIAHEFFHSLQYAMATSVNCNIFLDTYPISWLEGTAVLMEEAAFDYINDYLQYCGSFFFDPTQPMLDTRYDGISEYKSSLLLRWIYEHSAARPDITLIRKVFLDEGSDKRSLHDNLSRAASSAMQAWPLMLSRFFSTSYFTGNRSLPEIFIPDAALLPECRYPIVKPDSTGAVSKTIKPYGMHHFNFDISPYAPNQQIAFIIHSTIADGALPLHTDAYIEINGEPASVITPVTSMNAATNKLLLDGGHQNSTVLFIVPNPHPSRNSRVTVSAFLSPPSDAETIQITDGSDGDAMMTIEGRGLYGSGSVSAVSLTQRQQDGLKKQSITPRTSPFIVQCPAYWFSSARCLVAIAAPRSIDGFAQPKLPLSSTAIYQFNDSTGYWQPLASIHTDDGRQRWSALCSRNGTFCLMSQESDTYEIFPNPVRLHRHTAFTIEGGDIARVQIFSIDGSLIIARSIQSTAGDRTSSTPVEFPLRMTSSTRAIMPGNYVVVIHNSGKSSRTPTTKKLLVLP